MGYRLEHFLLFSPDVFWRLMESYVTQYFFIAVGFNLALLLCLLPALRTQRVKLGMILVTVAWVWLGWRFYIIEYASINWFARYLGATCLLLSPWLLYLSFTPATQPHKQDKTLLYLTVGYVIFLRPIVIGTVHDTWVISGIGLLPVPTLLLTLGMLLSLQFAFRWLLVGIVLLLLTIETVTLYMLEMVSWQEAPTAVMLMLALLMHRQSPVRRIRTGLS